MQDLLLNEGKHLARNGARFFASLRKHENGLLVPNGFRIFSVQLYTLVETVAPGLRAGRD